LVLDVLILDIAGTLITYPVQKQFDIQIDEVLNLLKMGHAPSQSFILFLLIYSVIVTILWGFYFTFFIGYNGQTPGKKLLRLRVEREDGSPVNYATAFNRFVGYSLSGGIFFVGFLWALWDKEKRTWHDKMAHTRVVKL